MSIKNATLMVSALCNRIYLGTMKKNSPFPVMNESRKDVTDEAIKAVFQHLKAEHEDHNKGTESFGYGFEGLGEIHFHPPENKTLKKIKSDE
jgi:hypothetical protein